MDNIDYVDMDIDKEVVDGLSVVERMKKSVSFGVNMNMSNKKIKDIMKRVKRREGKSRKYWECWKILNEKYNSEYEQEEREGRVKNF